MAASPRKKEAPPPPWTGDLPERRAPSKPKPTVHVKMPIGPFTKKAAESVIGWKRKSHDEPR